MTDDTTTEKIEKTETGFTFTVKSKRGTGTNDRDEVKAEQRTEHRPTEVERKQLLSDVKDAMTRLRSHQPDESEDDND